MKSAIQLYFVLYNAIQSCLWIWMTCIILSTILTSPSLESGYAQTYNNTQHLLGWQQFFSRISPNNLFFFFFKSEIGQSLALLEFVNALLGITSSSLLPIILQGGE